MTYATASDVATLLARELTAAEEAKAAVLLPVADAKIQQAVPTVAARLTAGTLEAGLVTFVAASLVARALTTTDGVTAVEESIDDYRKVERRDLTTAEGGFNLTPDEVDLLSPSEVAAGGAFTIRPYTVPIQRSVETAWWDRDQRIW